LTFAINQNTPNPFASATNIRFAIPDAKPVTLKIYNVEGRLVRDLIDRTMPAGRHEVTWDGRDATGARVTSGVYFYKFAAGTFTAERKMVVLQ
jgi:flagellar hook assembly protein FlgD